MREIKFRAWSSERMLYMGKGGYNDFELCGGEVYEIGMFDTRKRDYPLMQYTGLKDCKGVEIFEGDILTDTSPYKFTYVVTWREHGFSPFLYDGAGESYGEDYEVIGNIHQHPELLECEEN